MLDYGRDSFIIHCFYFTSILTSLVKVSARYCIHRKYAIIKSSLKSEKRNIFLKKHYSIRCPLRNIIMTGIGRFYILEFFNFIMSICYSKIFHCRQFRNVNNEICVVENHVYSFYSDKDESFINSPH